MTWLAILWSLILLELAGLHALWAARIWWPIRQEGALARAVAGFAGTDRMPPPAACAGVAVALTALASLPWWPDGPLRFLLLVSVAAVFGVRGIAARLPAWERLTPEQPFRTYDRLAYGPLCLGLAVLALLLSFT